MRIQERILHKLNEGREEDATPFTWDNTPASLKNFWYELLK